MHTHTPQNTPMKAICFHLKTHSLGGSDFLREGVLPGQRQLRQKGRDAAHLFTPHRRVPLKAASLLIPAGVFHLCWVLYVYHTLIFTLSLVQSPVFLSCASQPRELVQMQTPGQAAWGAA